MRHCDVVLLSVRLKQEIAKIKKRPHEIQTDLKVRVNPRRPFINFVSISATK